MSPETPKAQESVGTDTCFLARTQHIHFKPLPQAGDAVSTAQGFCTSLLLPLRGLAVQLESLKSPRHLLAKVHKEIMFPKKTNSLPSNQDERKDPVGESDQTVLFTHTHPHSKRPLLSFYPSLLKELQKMIY